MLVLRHYTDIQTCRQVAGFSIRNCQGKLIAMGAKGGAGSFVVITHKRYEHDRDLVAKVEQLSGMRARM